MRLNLRSARSRLSFSLTMTSNSITWPVRAHSGYLWAVNDRRSASWRQGPLPPDRPERCSKASVTSRNLTNSSRSPSFVLAPSCGDAHGVVRPDAGIVLCAVGLSPWAVPVRGAHDRRTDDAVGRLLELFGDWTRLDCRCSQTDQQRERRRCSLWQTRSLGNRADDAYACQAQGHSSRSWNRSFSPKHRAIRCFGRSTPIGDLRKPDIDHALSRLAAAVERIPPPRSQHGRIRPCPDRAGRGCSRTRTGTGSRTPGHACRRGKPVPEGRDDGGP